MKQIAFACALALAAPLAVSLPLTLMAPAAARAAEKLPLSAISAYLNGITTAKSSFTQINDDGSLSTGQLFLKRPGRARFQYDPPSGAAVIVGAGAVVIHDPKSNQPPESYPLSRTPLSIILASHVDLGRANMVVGHDFDGTATIVTAQDPDHPDAGSIQLMFTAAPVELRKWVIEDASGARTTVILGALETGMELPGSLFTSGGGGVPSNLR
ncbi:LolA family protein [Pseudodonghicola xiamenensis]|uniref:Outer-membrane lipoprotein carrier protein n=1 Tax=Pseudodonghicola xiamenensis TaxID=337702 RepID=A0A8J3H633_9RHOB|nr:outer membrane lipoprotein carrier protein LolA [Pseudodonghicola xiamenensis]GHG83640.1 outer-membrane lipoprotein carrier protein [Pseudodonghicola xiamenensis]